MWSDGASGPILWTQGTDIGTIAFVASAFPSVRELSCISERETFEELVAGEAPNSLGDVACR